MISLWRSARFLALGCFVMVAAAEARAAELAEVAARLRDAREKYTEMGQYVALYVARTDLARTAQGLQAQRDQQANYVRTLKVQLDGLPARRNSLQEGVHQEWLQARNVLIDLDSQLAAVHASGRELEEQALALTAMNKKRILPSNRRGLQAVFPTIREECASTFRSLQEAADEFAGAQGVTRDEVINRAMATLGRKAEVEAQYGPTKSFLYDFRRFCNSRRLDAIPGGRARR